MIGLGLLFVAGCWLQLPWVNGPWYWQWTWRELPIYPTLLPFLPPLGLIAAVWWQHQSVESLSALRLTALLALLAIATLLFQLAAILSEPASFDLLKAIVLSKWATSFYTDALAIGDSAGWLSQFHLIEKTFHAAVSPPGPILIYRTFIRMLGPEGGALPGAIFVCCVSAFNAPLFYAFQGLYAGRQSEAARVHLVRHAAFAGALLSVL